MSFILEALKRSENERQRQSGPALASAPTGTHVKTRSPWVTIIAALLLLNAAVLGYLLLRSDAPPTGTTPAASAPLQSASVQTAANGASRAPEIVAPRPAPVRGAEPAGTPATAPVTSRATADPPATTQAPVNPPVTTPAVQPRPRGPVRSLSGEVYSPPPPDASITSGVAATAPGSATGSPIVREYTNLPSAPVQTAAPAPRPAQPTPSYASLPTAQDLALRGELTGLPLHLDLHVYYADPARRLVFVNGRKYVEGESLDAGPTVDEIVPEGVILDRGGQRFLLPAE